mgnify:CR=1 FL=1
MFENKMVRGFKKRGKKGLSAIVGALLLILLVVVGIGLIFAFVVPFVKNNLEDVKTCADIIGKVELNPEFTCTGYEMLGPTGSGCNIVNENTGCITKYWNATQNQCLPGSSAVQSLASVSTGEIKLEGLVFRITAVGKTKNFIVKDGGIDGDYVKIANYHPEGSQFAATPGCVGGADNCKLVLPKANEGWTYVFNVDAIAKEGNLCYQPTRVEVAPIVNGKQCDFVDSIEFVSCKGSQLSP